MHNFTLANSILTVVSIVLGTGLALLLFRSKHPGLILFVIYSSLVLIVAYALRNASGLEGVLWAFPLYLGYPANILGTTVQEAYTRIFSPKSGLSDIMSPLLMIMYGGLQWFYIGSIRRLLAPAFGKLPQGPADITEKHKPSPGIIDASALILTVIAILLYLLSLAGIAFKTKTLSLPSTGPVKATVFYSNPDLGRVSRIIYFTRNGSLLCRLVGTHGAVVLDAGKNIVDKTVYNFPGKYYEWMKNAAEFVGSDANPAYVVCSPGSGSDLTFFGADGSVLWQYKFNCGSCVLGTMDSADLRGKGVYEAVCVVSLAEGMGIGIPDIKKKSFRLVKEGLFSQACAADIYGNNKYEIAFSGYGPKDGFGIMDASGNILGHIGYPSDKYVRCLSVTGWFDSRVNNKLLFADDNAAHVMGLDGKILWNYEYPGPRGRVAGAMLTDEKTGMKYFACLLSSGSPDSPSMLVVIDSGLKQVFKMQLEGDCPGMDGYGNYALIGASSRVYRLDAGN
jgi:hypothetical protein